MAAFRSRILAHTSFAYVFIDATYLKARVDGWVVSRAVVIATGVTADGGREVLGLNVGDSEDGAILIAFLRSLKACGLTGVQLVIFDAHIGLKQVIAEVMAGAGWQRCRVHFLRNVLASVSKGSGEMVAAAIRTIFAQPTGAEVDRSYVLSSRPVMCSPPPPVHTFRFTLAMRRRCCRCSSCFPPAEPQTELPLAARRGRPPAGGRPLGELSRHAGI